MGSSGTSLARSVTLNGTLPPGWTVVVFHLSGTDILLNSAISGKFSRQAVLADV
jgi:hypothetical protein